MTELASTSERRSPAPSTTPATGDGRPACRSALSSTTTAASVTSSRSFCTAPASTPRNSPTAESSARRSSKRHPRSRSFINVGLEFGEAIASLIALAKRGYFGFVQLMSSRGSAVLEHVKSVGDAAPAANAAGAQEAIRYLGHRQDHAGAQVRPRGADGGTHRPRRGAADSAGSNSGISRRSICGKSSSPASRPLPARAIRNTACCRRPRSCRARPSPSCMTLSELALNAALKTSQTFSQTRGQSALCRQCSGERAGQIVDPATSCARTARRSIIGRD